MTTTDRHHTRTCRDPVAAFRLDGSIAIVTGASSGLGAHFTRTLHDAGATIVAAARRTDRLLAVVDDLERASPIAVDLVMAADRERLVRDVLEQHGRIDVLVNDAGTSVPGPVEAEELDDFRSVLELNVTAVWQLAKLAGASMVAQGTGSIVNVASVLGHVASAPMDQANYAASKGAVVNLTRELAVQWARRGVRVNALCPGFFPSELTAEVTEDPKVLAFVERSTPMGRLGTLEELDGALLLLCSGAGRYITGTSLFVDGGWTAR